MKLTGQDLNHDDTFEERIEALLEENDELTAWEVTFLESVLDAVVDERGLTDTQVATLEEIESK